MEIIPILKSFSTVKDVRGIIKKIYEETGITHSESNQQVNNLYQNPKNIKIEDRLNYQYVIGNYYPPLDEFDPYVIK